MKKKKITDKPIKRFIRNKYGTFPAVVIPESTYKKLIKDKKRLNWLDKNLHNDNGMTFNGMIYSKSARSTIDSAIREEKR